MNSTMKSLLEEDAQGSPNKGPHSKRITKPPGGETNEIFTNTTPQSTPPSTPRKVKNYMASSIFTPEVQPGTEPRNIRHRPDDDSFKRLFGANGVDMTDSRKNHQKSSIIFADAGVNGKVNGHDTNGHTNGHTNGNGVENGSSGSSTPNGTNGHSNGHVENGTKNGSHVKTNGTNGAHENGSSNGTTNGTPKRIPPGGFSSKLW